MNYSYNTFYILNTVMYNYKYLTCKNISSSFSIFPWLHAPEENVVFFGQFSATFFSNFF